MPSGAKKRKAARKKKESQAHLNESTNSPQGTDHEVKSQDEKDSDVDSPRPQDMEELENPFCKGTELVLEGDPSASPSLPAENNSNSAEVINGSGKESLMMFTEPLNVSTERNDEPSTEPVNVSNERIDEQSAVTLVDRSGMSENSPQEESFSPAIAVASDDPVGTLDSAFNKENVTDTPVQNTVIVVSESSTLSADEPVVTLSQLSGQVTEHSATEVPVINMENGTPAAGSDLTLKSINDRANPPTDVNVKASSCGVRQKSKPNDSEELPSSQLPVAVRTSSDIHVKISGIPEGHENQPLVASAPRLVQRTSWLSCCGLLEVLSGSN